MEFSEIFLLDFGVVLTYEMHEQHLVFTNFPMWNSIRLFFEQIQCHQLNVGHIIIANFCYIHLENQAKL